MKLYRINVQDPVEGCIVGWAANKIDADATAKAIAHYRGIDFNQHTVNVFSVEIPTTKAGLVQWLNRNFITNNG